MLVYLAVGYAALLVVIVVGLTILHGADHNHCAAHGCRRRRKCGWIVCGECLDEIRRSENTGAAIQDKLRGQPPA